MKSISTILGDIDADQLGFCQCHEHLLIGKGQSFQINPVLLLDEIYKSIEEANLYKSAGGNSIVDAQPTGCNRMPIGLAQISKETGIHILSSTGFHKMIFYPIDHWIFSIEKDELAQLYINELTIGMLLNCDTSLTKEQCSFKASIIKTALDKEGLTPQYLKLFSAAATASLKTGTTMMIHIEQDSPVLELFNFLVLQGIPARKLIFCHMDRACSNLSIHKQLCKNGSYLEYDTIGRFKYHDNNREIDIIKELIDSGYEDQLLISLDSTRARLKAYGGDIGLDYILTTFIPLMKKAGITESQIYKISRENSIHALCRY